MWLSYDCHVTYQTDPYLALSTLVIWVHCKSSETVNANNYQYFNNKIFAIYGIWFASNSTVICEIFVVKTFCFEHNAENFLHENILPVLAYTVNIWLMLDINENIVA